MYAYLPLLYQAPRIDAQVRQRAKFNIIARLIKLVSPVMITIHQQASSPLNGTSIPSPQSRFLFSPSNKRYADTLKEA